MHISITSQDGVVKAELVDTDDKAMLVGNVESIQESTNHIYIYGDTWTLIIHKASNKFTAVI